MDEYPIVPFDEHPPDSVGAVRYRPNDAPRPVLGACEAAAHDPAIAPLAHRHCHGNGEVHLPNDPPTVRPIYVCRCACSRHRQPETDR